MLEMVNSFWPLARTRAAQGLCTIVTPTVNVWYRMRMMDRRRWKCNIDIGPFMACRPTTRAAASSVNDEFSLRKGLDLRQ